MQLIDEGIEEFSIGIFDMLVRLLLYTYINHFFFSLYFFFFFFSFYF